jgi:TolA-binding protein
MAVLRRWILLWTLLWAAAPRVLAATEETRAFNAAAMALQDGLYRQAERDFGDFAQKYPTSPRLPEAILGQAEARLKQSNYDGAIDLLSRFQNQAGKWADTNCFWLGEAYFQKQDFRAAAEMFAKLARDFPASYWRLEAVLREAAARAKVAEWSNVVQVLQQTNSAFQAAVGRHVTNDLVAQGYLLLGEAHLAQQHCEGALAALQRLAGFPLPSALDWQRQYLLGRILLADGHTQEALRSTTNLMALAVASGQRSFQAETAAFQAGLLENLGRTDEAIAAYQNNLVEGTPLDRQKQANLKIAHLFLLQGRISEAAQRVEEILSRFPKEPASELGLLTLGELRLRQHQAGTASSPPVSAETNAPAKADYLEQALVALQNFTNQFPQSPLLGRAEYYLGWCFWLQTNVPASQAAFQAAVRLLPKSADQANAYFKLADAQLAQTNLAGAIANYQAVVEGFPGLDEVQTNLVEPALYQMVRASLATNDLAIATNAVDRILARFPNGFYTEPALLSTGLRIGSNSPAGARQLFSDFAARAPEAPLLPEVELAIARTYEQEEKWPEAIDCYERWLQVFTNAPDQAQAEFARAWANSLAGRDTNALTLFTNFVARYPTSELAPYAQSWVADYYLRMSKTWEAEQVYQLIFRNTNWAGSPVAYRAKLMAGQAAAAHYSWKDATNYFTMLTSDPKCPPDLWLSAMFGYGDTLMRYDVPETNRPALLQTAAAIFGKICDAAPTNQIAALAWGEMAQCLLQYAKDQQDFEAVSNAFQRAILTPGADVKARSIAKVGLGTTLEKMAAQKTGAERENLLQLACTQYTDVAYGDHEFLREGEQQDLFWTRKALREAARLLELLNQPDAARNLLSRAQKMFPSPDIADKLGPLNTRPPAAGQ